MKFIVDITDKEICRLGNYLSGKYENPGEQEYDRLNCMNLWRKIRRTYDKAK